jgi:hypothetical protein
MAYKIKRKKPQLEQGEASFKMKLSNGKIKVLHGTSGQVLYKTKAKEGYWDNVWKAIKSKKFKA